MEDDKERDDLAALRRGENAWLIQAGYVDPTLLELFESEDQSRIFISNNARPSTTVWLWALPALIGSCFFLFVGVLAVAPDEPVPLVITGCMGLASAFSLRESRYFVDRRSKTFVIEKRIAFSWLAWKRTFPIREDFRFVVLKSRANKAECWLCAAQHAPRTERSGSWWHFSGTRWLLKVGDHPLHTAAVRTLAYRLNQIVEELAEDRHSELDHRSNGAGAGD